MLSKYLRRPEDIELICPNQFGKMFTTSGVKQNKNDKKTLQENESENPDAVSHESPEMPEEIGHSNYDTNKKKFHFIITEADEMVPLPKLIKISDLYPGEPKWMRKRKGPAVIRYHKVNRDKQYERWMS